MEQLPEFLLALTPKQVKALPFLAAGESAAEVSRKLKISKQSLSEWKKDKNFSNALKCTRNEVLNEAVLAIEGLASKSVQTLMSLMVNSSNEQIKLRSAIFIIEHLELKSLHKNDVGNDQEGISPVDMDMLFDAIGISET